MKCGGQEFCSN